MLRFLCFGIMALGLQVTGVHAQQQTMSLAQCRRMAVEQNHKIQQAEAHQNAIGSLTRAAQTQLYPKASFTGAYLHTNKDFQLLDQDVFLPVVPHEVYQQGIGSLQTNPELMEQALVTTDFFGQQVPVLDDEGNPLFKEYAYLPKDEVGLGLQNMYLLNVGVTQPIYTGGKIRAMVDIAEQTAGLFEARKELATQEVILQTDQYYWNVIALQEKVWLTRAYQKMVDTLIYDLQNLYHEGIITRNEVLKAQVKRNSITLMLTRAENGLALTRMALNQTLGLPLDTVLVLQADERIEPSLLADEKNGIRPEIRMAEQAIQIADGAVKLMRSRFFPDIAMVANYTYMNPNPYKGLAHSFGGDWNVGVMLNVPIFHWGDKQHTLQAAKYEKQAAQAKYDEAQELVNLSVTKAQFSLQEAQKRLELTLASLAQAEENLKVTRDNFSEGLVKTTDVLEAQALWQEAHSDFIEAKTEVHLAISEYQKAKGILMVSPVLEE